MTRPSRHVSALAVLAACLLLAPAAGGQQMPEPQRLERCENNRRAIIDYERRGRELLALWEVAYAEAPARNQYARLNKAIAAGETLPEYGDPEGRVEFAKAENLEWDGRWRDDAMAFQKALRDRFGQLLDKAKAYGSADKVADERKEVERKIEQHRTNLAALRCDEAAGRCADISGSWKHDSGDAGSSTWEITKSGGGYFARESGLGAATGPATLEGKELTIDWRTPDQVYAGKYIWRLDEGCTSGTGELIFDRKPAGDSRAASRPSTVTRQ